MKWNGTVSHWGTRSMAARLASENSTHATSNHRTRLGHSEASCRIDAISHPSVGGDHGGPELRAEPANAYVDDVRPRIEVEAPYRRQEAFLRDRAAGVPHQLAQQPELSIRERDRSGARVGDPVDDIERQALGDEMGLVGPLRGSQPSPDPGEQLLQRERLRDVVLGATFEALHLRRR